MEFLFDSSLNYYFMEVNTRIQVEHTITEMVTGIDLVKEQIKCCAGLPLSIKQEEITWSGHAIQFRINAEDPEMGFAPNPGLITGYHAPAGIGIRLDSCAFTGWEIPHYYDSLIAKMSVWGRDRAEAVERGKAALREYYISGVKTTIPFFLNLLEEEEFIEGQVDTGFLPARLESLTTPKDCDMIVELPDGLFAGHSPQVIQEDAEDRINAILAAAVSLYLGYEPRTIQDTGPKDVYNPWQMDGRVRNQMSKIDSVHGYAP